MIRIYFQLYFPISGLGWLTSVDLPNVERRSSRDSTGGRRMSMEEYDTPNIRRLSLTGGGN